MNPSAKELRARLEGALIPAVPAPHGASGAHDPAAEARLVQYQADSPSAGVALWVHTGRGLMLAPAARADIFKRWRAGLRADQFIVAGVGCPHPPPGAAEMTDAEYIARAAAMAEEAKRLGADGVLVYAPARFRGRAGAEPLILRYHEAIAEAGAPMILFYLYEAAGGLSYSLELLERLFALPSVAGIKVATLDSVMTYQAIAELARERAPQIALVTGEDRFFGYTVMRGAVGALIGMGSACPAQQAGLLAAWRAKQYDRFLELSRAIDLFAETTFIAPMEGYIRRMMLALASLGVLPESATFDPWGPEVPAAEIERIGAAAASLAAL